MVDPTETFRIDGNYWRYKCIGKLYILRIDCLEVGYQTIEYIYYQTRVINRYCNIR